MPKNLLIALFLLICKVVPAQLTYQTLQVDYDSAKTFKNLKIIPIRFKGPGDGRIRPEIISLNKALQQGLAVVSERGTASTENVHWLRINNNSNKAIFVGSGEVILGGRQDRMTSKDTIMLASQPRMQIAVMCAEEGRWSDKEKKFQYQHQANMRLRKVLDRSKNQVNIWREIYNQLDRDKVKNTTFAYLSRRQDKNYAAAEKEYFDFFKNRIKNQDSTIVGVICVSGNQVIGSDIFAGTNLFYSEFSSLIYGYIQDAIVFGSPPKLWDVRVKEYTDKFLKDEISQELWLKDNGKLYKYQGKVFHLTSY